MIRKAFVIRAMPGMAAEYESRHNPIWPELKDALTYYGVSNYSIFLHQETGFLFGYMEVSSENTLAELAKTEVCKKWWRYMTEVLVCDNSGSPEQLKAKEDELLQVFYLK